MVTVDKKIIVILGPTASGKTGVGVRLARKFSGEIISADSRQVYQGMDVGTGASKSYKNVPYHLIDVARPKSNFNVAKYQKLAYGAIKDILARGKTPIIVGGTGLYINAVTEGFQFDNLLITNYQLRILRKKLEKLSLKQLLVKLKKIDPATYKVIDRQNRRRVQRAVEIYFQTGRPKSQVVNKDKPPYTFLKIGINYPREVLARRIDKRLAQRLEKEDMIGEVRRLHKNGVSWKRLESFGLEYKWLARYLQKKVDYQKYVASLAKEIKDFEKRQMTWFKRDKEIVWENNYYKIEKMVRIFLKQ